MSYLYAVAGDIAGERTLLPTILLKSRVLPKIQRFTDVPIVS